VRAPSCLWWPLPPTEQPVIKEHNQRLWPTSERVVRRNEGTYIRVGYSGVAHNRCELASNKKHLI
jgi:hypothetical protein